MAGIFEGKVRLPVVGEVPKLAAYGGGAVLAVLAFSWWRNRSTATASSSSATASGAAGDPYPPDGTTGNPSDPNSTDPATGLTYGDEQAGYGTSSTGAYGGSGVPGDEFPWDGTTGNPSDPYSMDPATGITYGDEGSYGGGSAGGGGTGTSGPPFTTNAQWSQYAENYLTTTVGQSASKVSDALGLYIAGGKVTTAQKDLIDQAIAYAGNPPVSGPNGRPPGINVGGSSSGGKGPSVTVPRVVDDRKEDAESALKSAGFDYETVPKNPDPKKGYTVTAQAPAAGRKAARGSLVTITLKETAATGKKAVTSEASAVR